MVVSNIYFILYLKTRNALGLPIYFIPSYENTSIGFHSHVCPMVSEEFCGVRQSENNLFSFLKKEKINMSEVLNNANEKLVQMNRKLITKSSNTYKVLFRTGE